MRPRRLAIVTVAAAVGLGVGALSATAAPAAGPTARQLAKDDAVLVVGTRIACFRLTAATSTGVVKPGIACFLGDTAHGGWIPATFGVALASDGEVVVSKIAADGSPQRVFRRLAQSSATGKVYRLAAGSLFGFPVSSKLSLLCSIINVKPADAAPLYRGIRVACWRHGTTPLPNSLGISISEKVAGVYRYDAKGHPGANVTVRTQPTKLG